jgi:long-subunit acyl-CoA synthetase (AMP-forming)
VKLVLINDQATAPRSKLQFFAEYEEMLRSASASFTFPDLPEGTRATTFYTTGTTGLPKGVYYSHRQLVLHTSRSRRRSRIPRTPPSRRATCTCRSRRCSTSTRGACRTSRRCSA